MGRYAGNVSKYQANAKFPQQKSKPWKKIHRNGCQSRHMFRSPIHEGARWRYHLYYRIHCRQSKKKRFIDSYLKSIYPESLGRAWTLGGPSVPPSLVRRSGSPDLLVRSDGEFSAVEGMPLESSLSKASQKSNTTERKKRQGQLGGGLGLPVKIPDDAYGADSNVYSRSLRQIGIGARSLLSGTLDGLSLGLAKPGTTLSDYLGLPKPEKGTPEELVSGLIRGAADMAPAIYSRGQTWQRPQQRIQKLKCSENILRLLLTCRPGWGDWRDFSMSWEKVEVINTVSRRLQYSTGSEYQHQRY